MSQLTMTEQQNLRIIVEAFFGKQNTAHWEMNEALLNVITKMMQADQSCSEAMDFVPRPGGYLGPKDVLKELERIAKRILSGDKSYVTCKTAVAYKWRTEAEMAAQGL